MTDSERAPSERFDALAAPWTYAAVWAEAMSDIMQSSIAAWAAAAKTCGQVGQAYAGLLGQAIEAERDETQALAEGADQLLQTELRVLEEGTEQLAYAAEETLAHMAGAPLIPLPE